MSMAKDRRIFLVFDEPDVNLFDLYQILESNSIQILPARMPRPKDWLTEKQMVSSVREIMLNYKETCEEQLNEADLVICVVTNGFVQSQACMKLISQAENNRIPMVSLIIERLRDLDDVKRGLLRNSISHFEVFKDRVHEKGYDQYMWLGESFEHCIHFIRSKLDIKNGFHQNAMDRFHFSYLFSNPESARKVKAILKMFFDVLCVVPFDCIPVLSGLVDFLCYTNGPKEVASHLGHNFYEYMLTRKSINVNVEYYAAIVRTFDTIVQKVDLNKTKPETSLRHPKYGSVYRHVKGILGESHSKDDVLMECLGASMKEFGIELDYLNKILGATHQNWTFTLEYFRLNDTRPILFLLTKDYYSSETFKKLYSEARRVRKTTFLLKLDEFELNSMDSLYDHARVYEIYKDADCMFYGYSTMKLLVNVAELCLPVMDWVDNMWYHLSIISVDCEFIKKLKNAFENQSMRVKCNLEDENEVMDSIEKTKVVLFGLTNEYLKTEKFQRNFAYAEKKNKQMLFVLMEEIVECVEVDLSSFSVIRMYENGCQLNGKAFYKLCYFVYSLLDSQQNRLTFENGEVKLQTIDSEYEELHRQRDGVSVEFGKLVSKIERKFASIKAVTYVKHLEAFWFITNDDIHCFNSKFKFISTIGYPEVIDGCVDFITVLYDEDKCNFYFVINMDSEIRINMFDRDLQKQFSTTAFHTCWFVPRSYHIHKSRIFVTNSDSFIVYNFKLDLIHERFTREFKEQAHESQISAELRSNNYAFFPRVRLEAFNTYSFTFNGKLRVSSDLLDLPRSLFCQFIAHNFSFYQGETGVYVHELKYGHHDAPIDACLVGFACKLNNSHLLKHPCWLPCGSLACLECILENYNFYLKEFICSFCDKEHVLTDQLVFSTVIEENLPRISEVQCAHLKQWVDKTAALKLECLDRRFEFLEEELEIRIESLKTAFDRHQELQNEGFAKLEQRLLKKSKASEEKKNAFDRPSILVKFASRKKNSLSDKQVGVVSFGDQETHFN